jgi:hypothetical protein
MDPKMLLLTSAGVAVSAFAILIVNDQYRRQCIRRNGGTHVRSAGVQTRRWPDRTECVDFGVRIV